MAANIYDSILLFGDSITEGGWTAGGLAQRLAGLFIILAGGGTSVIVFRQRLMGVGWMS